MVANMTSKEIWASINGFDIYEVSTEGRVRSTDETLKGARIRKQRRKNNGYLEVNLWNRKQRCYSYHLVHRLVLETFVGPCPEGMVACHANGDRTDNRLCNLRWDTRKQNEADKAQHGTRLVGERTNSVKLTEAGVIYIREQYCARTGRLWGCLDLARRYDVHPSTIIRVAKGEYWSHVR